MPTASLIIDPGHVTTTIDPRLYGGFVEHLGRCVYGGVYEPGHPTADANGFRGDVLREVRALRPPIIRYPGGNFVSAYNWEDGVGPRAQRPRRLDFAWHTTETNQVGTNEFVDWCRLAGAEPLMAVNLGTRGMEDARRLLEYCNHPGGSALSDLRIAHGWREPHNIRVWCLGNEMDGPWQTGHKTAEEYGRLAAETARAMRQFDQKLELVACGSCTAGLPTYPEWDRVVLEHAHELVDYLSLHIYVNDLGRTRADYLGGNLVMDRQLRTITGLCDYMQGRHRSKKQMMLCFDEWNVWNWFLKNGPGFERWQEAPAQVEQTYTSLDAVVFGTLLITLLKHAARVRIGCIAQLVNVIAPIMTETGGRCWRQSIFYPLLHGSLYGRGELIGLQLHSPCYESAEFGEVPWLEAVATRDPASGDLTLFAVNRHESESLALAARLHGDGRYRIREHLVLAHPDPLAVNTADAPETVVPRRQTGASCRAGRLKASLPPLSWNVLRLALQS